jgi:ABC-type polysaccharide/polyol phosphate transport system ATPase subunit
MQTQTLISRQSVDSADGPAVAEVGAGVSAAAVGRSSDADCLIEAEAVGKKFCRGLKRSLWYGACDIAADLSMRRRPDASLRKGEFWAVHDVTFRLRRGDSLGLIGHNGAGKSTLLKLLTGQRALTSGRVTTRGRIVALTDLGLGFDPVLTGRENAYVNAAVLGLPRRELRPIIDRVIEFAGLREFIDAPVQTYSSGMRARLGFAVAAHLEPDILMVDEVLAVGDINFRRKCIQHVSRYLARGGSLVLVAHDPYLIQTVCNRCIVLDQGKIIFDGSSVEGVGLHFRLGHAMEYDSARTVPGDGAAAAGQAAESGQLSSSDSRSVTVSAERPVAIQSIEILPVQGPMLATGAPARVVLRCRAWEAAEVVWGFVIYTPDSLVAISSCATGLDGPGTRLSPGDNELTCLVPQLPLRAGVYSLRSGICDHQTGAPVALFGYEDSPAFFSVGARSDTRTNNVAMVVQDLIEMKVEWPRL